MAFTQARILVSVWPERVGTWKVWSTLFIETSVAASLILEDSGAARWCRERVANIWKNGIGTVPAAR